MSPIFQGSFGPDHTAFLHTTVDFSVYFSLHCFHMSIVQSILSIPVLPYLAYISISGPKGYGFSAVLVVKRVSILADFINRVWFHK